MGTDKNQDQLPNAWSLKNDEELDSTPCPLPPRFIAYGDSHTQVEARE